MHGIKRDHSGKRALRGEIVSILEAGVWIWDIERDQVVLDPTRTKPPGRGESCADRMAEFLAAVHDDDRGRVRVAIDHCLEGRGPYLSEHRLRRDDGTVVRVVEHGDVVRHPADGRALKLVASRTELPGPRPAASAATPDERHQAIVEDQTEMICRYDADGIHTFVNGAYARARGRSAEALLGRSAYANMSEADLERLKALYATLTPENPVGKFELSFTNRDGRTVWQLWTKRAVFDDDGHVVEYQAVGHDITTLKQAEAALLEQQETLNRALAEAERANQAKSRFLATMSHELRTPLNAIIGFAEMLAGEVFGPFPSPKYREYARDIQASSTHLLQLVDDILDLTAIEAGRQQLRPEQLDIADVARDCIAIVQPALQRKSIAHRLSLPPALPPLVADRRAVKQILINLLYNAIKFTPEHGAIALEARTAERAIHLSVSDTGRGIPADKLATITEPFVRTEPDPYKSYEGKGLGLAIVKSLVELHDGRLAIDSQLGRGTVVMVTLPHRAPNAAAR